MKARGPRPGKTNAFSKLLEVAGTEMKGVGGVFEDVARSLKESRANFTHTCILVLHHTLDCPASLFGQLKEGLVFGY